MKTKISLLFLLLCSVFILSSCSNDDDDDSTAVTIYVSATTGTYEIFGGDRLEGMRIREEGSTRWNCVRFDLISGFTYEKGKAYILRVMKTRISNPPQDDAEMHEYRLIRQQVVEDTSGWE
ncbi:MAG: DUF4377 domain-containing protein [Bacteroidales bacterium]|nr:DUF4377 domain-containing protein [Bacteroidales bacterium]MCM1146853.1 DUF4377 domain-containing protein [Bacteroidales bacterium]MCM1205649.1 DUF4377 domain-containing protein [Bacillota bacterium]MCM1510239.1 DUF4377 domain-containing protein [Clostridium sp.]